VVGLSQLTTCNISDRSFFPMRGTVTASAG
jgi:hypothetical protein